MAREHDPDGRTEGEGGPDGESWPDGVQGQTHSSIRTIGDDRRSRGISQNSCNELFWEFWPIAAKEGPALGGGGRGFRSGSLSTLALELEPCDFAVRILECFHDDRVFAFEGAAE